MVKHSLQILFFLIKWRLQEEARGPWPPVWDWSPLPHLNFTHRENRPNDCIVGWTRTISCMYIYKPLHELPLLASIVLLFPEKIVYKMFSKSNVLYKVTGTSKQISPYFGPCLSDNNLDPFAPQLHQTGAATALTPFSICYTNKYAVTPVWVWMSMRQMILAVNCRFW